jgi:hypothetical protein
LKCLRILNAGFRQATACFFVVCVQIILTSDAMDADAFAVNDSGDDGAASIADALQINNSLLSLNLSGTGLSTC